MSSKQINFFIATKDISDISNFIKEQQCKIIKGKLETPVTEYNIEINNEMVFQVYLFKNSTDILISTNNGDALDRVDIISSNCVEFVIGGFYPYSDKVLHRSRLYYVSEYYENDKRIRKNDEFISWADGFIKAFKKKFLLKSIEHQGLLSTKNCLDWVKTSNAILSGGGLKFIIP